MTNEEIKRSLIQDVSYDHLPWFVLCCDVPGEKLTEILRRESKEEREEGMRGVVVQTADIERIEFLLGKMEEQSRKPEPIVIGFVQDGKTKICQIG